MALGAGVVIPNVLRWYWWRMNGWGYAAGTVAGILFSLIALLMPELPMYVVFPPIVMTSLLVSVITALLTPAVDEPILISFYETIRPFGFWRPVRSRSRLSAEVLADSSESCWRAVLNTSLGMVAITGIYLFPMYLVGHWYTKAFIWISAALMAAVALAFTWYRYLPPRH
jgi:SSS family solute:Na+ symporter